MAHMFGRGFPLVTLAAEHFREGSLFGRLEGYNMAGADDMIHLGEGKPTDGMAFTVMDGKGPHGRTTYVHPALTAALPKNANYWWPRAELRLIEGEAFLRPAPEGLEPGHDWIVFTLETTTGAFASVLPLPKEAPPACPFCGAEIWQMISVQVGEASSSALCCIAEACVIKAKHAALRQPEPSAPST